MSYEPTIIICKADLEAKRAEIESWEYQEPKRPSAKFRRKQEAYKFLQGVLKFTTFTLKGMEMIMFQPELTSRNADVRQALNDMDIEYALDN